MQDLQFQICGDYSGRWEPGTPSVPSQLADEEHFFLARWKDGDAQLGWFGIYHPALADIKEKLPQLAAQITRDASSPARWDNLKYLSHHIPGWGLYYARPDYIRLWRDPFGILPIVLSFRDRGVQWATRPKFLPTPPTKIRQSRVEIFLRAQNESARDDFWQGVYRLRAGETLLFRPNRRKIYQTWWPGPVKELDEAHDLEERTEELLQASLERAMKRGANAVSLSGGVDSTLLLAMIVESGRTPQAFSMIEPNAPFFHEQEIVEVTSETLNVKVDFFNIGQRLEWPNPKIHHPLPDFGPAALAGAAYFRSYLKEIDNKLCAETPRILITGQGADHLFSCTQGELLGARAAKSYLWRDWQYYRSKRTALRHLLHYFRIPTPARDTSQSRLAPWNLSYSRRLDFYLLEPMNIEEQRVRKTLQFQAWRWEEMCRMAERYRRESGVWSVYPFLEPEIAEFAFAISPFKLRTPTLNKIVLRRLLANHVPEAVARRPKRGAFDEVVWTALAKYLDPSFEELLNPDVLGQLPLKNRKLIGEEIKNLRKNTMKIGRAYGHELWRLLAVSMWMRVLRGKID